METANSVPMLELIEKDLFTLLEEQSEIILAIEGRIDRLDRVHQKESSVAPKPPDQKPGIPTYIDQLRKACVWLQYRNENLRGIKEHLTNIVGGSITNTNEPIGKASNF